MLLSPWKLMNQLVLLSVLLAALPLHGTESQDVQERYTRVAMRMIGHEVLKCLGDADSRVLPIEKVDDRYQISFSTGLAFDPSDLVSVIIDVMEQAAVADNYLVEVGHCTSQEVVYAFAVMQSDNGNITPCTGRMLSEACYQFWVTFMDDAVRDTDLAVTQGNYSQVTSRRITSGDNFLSASFVQIRLWVLPLLFFVGLISFLFTRKSSVVEAPSPSQIGAFYFDQRTQVLTIENTQIQLSHKEAELLQVLHQSANTPVERAVLLEKVWGDKGNYIGRTLDVFISKLRKKLAADDSLQIVNVRGIGYKLVMAV